MKKISVLGYYGHRNCGDDALQLAMEKIFDGYADYQFISPSDQLPAENIVLGGGDVIKQYFLKRIGGQPFKILGAGLGYQSELELLPKDLVEEAVFRNYEDTVAATAQGFKASYTPDLAFMLDVPEGQPVVKRSAHKKKKLLGILVADNVSLSNGQRDLQQVAYGQYLKAELALALHDLREYYKMVFIPMSHAKGAFDVKMCYEIVSFLPENLEWEIFPEPLDKLKTIKAISEMDTVISMRFHGLIFSTIATTPYVNIGLSRKTHLFAKENEMGACSFEPFTMTAKGILEKIKIAEAPETKVIMEERRKANKDGIGFVVDHVRKYWCV